MSEAPERIWAARHPSGSLEALDYFCTGAEEYIRADIHEARVKELELPADDTRSYDKGYTQGYSEGWDDGEDMVRVALDEAVTRVKELETVVKKLWRRQDSLDTFDAAVNNILAPLFEK